MFLSFLCATLALATASAAAVYATERAASPLTGARGWCVTAALVCTAGLALRTWLPTPETLAVAALLPMAAIPLMALAHGRRRRRTV